MGRHRWFLGLAILLMVFPAGCGAAPLGVSTLPQTLPEASSGMASVWDPRDRPAAGCPQGCAYLFGGTGRGIGIVQFNPRDGTVFRMQARLPSELNFVAAAWTGSSAYLFGGSPLTDRILEYTPDTDTLRTLDARLPAPQMGSAAVWTGSVVFLFGGVEEGRPSRRIVRFDPAQETVLSIGELPQPRFRPAAAWDGSRVLVAGGWAGDTPEAPVEIYRYDPPLNAVSTLEARLPHGVVHAAYASDGRGLYLAGGYHPPVSYSDELMRVSLADGTAQVIPYRLPSPRTEATGVWTGTEAYLFGGRDAQGDLREILAFSPPPTALQPIPTGNLAGQATSATSPGSSPSSAPAGGDAGASWGGVVAAGSVVLASIAALLVARWRRGPRGPPSRAPAPSPATPLASVPVALRVESLSVQQDGRPTLHPTSLEVPAGGLTIVLGPSGAGKSTLLRAIAGLVPCGGRIQVRGRWSAPGAPSAKAALGYVPQSLQLYADLTPLANLAYFGAQFGLRPAEAKARGRDLLRGLGLEGLERRPVDRLSGGEQRRVSIAAALVHRPALVVLDEPTSGLDLANRKALWMVLQRLAREQGVGVLASSHFIDDAAYADQVGILVAGRMAALGSPRALVQSLPGEGRCVEVEFETLDAAARRSLDAILPRLRAQGLVEWMEPRLFSVRFFAKDPRGAARILPEVLFRNNLRVRATRLDDVQMEDVFSLHAGAAKVPP